MLVTAPWSDEARAATRAALSTQSSLPIGKGIAFKHANGPFALMTDDDGLAGRLVLTDRRSGAVATFQTVDALLDAGWVVD